MKETVRRMLLVLAAVAVMAAIMTLSLSTAFAKAPGCLPEFCEIVKGIAVAESASGDNSGDHVGGINTRNEGVTNNPKLDVTPCPIGVVCP